jgi:hypothetical protein
VEYQSDVSLEVTTFRNCPNGYCCDGTSNAPCTGIDSCAGDREGRLCGRCPEGYGEVFASSQCRKGSECDDGDAVWVVVAILLIAEGCMLLTSGEIWFVRKGMPDGVVKLVSYYFQVRSRAWFRLM